MVLDVSRSKAQGSTQCCIGLFHATTGSMFAITHELAQGHNAYL